jgi:hypothetical protein
MLALARLGSRTFVEWGGCTLLEHAGSGETRRLKAVAGGTRPTDVGRVKAKLRIVLGALVAIGLQAGIWADDGDAAKPAKPAKRAATCPLSTPGSNIGMSLSGCTTIASDTAANADPIPFWGSIECQLASRHQQVSSGGDAHVRANGAAQGDTAFRRLTVIDGDDFYGERCELGKNDHRDGPTVFYREGMRRVTFLSERLSSGVLSVNTWQTVFQMKQAQPSDGGGNQPALAMDAYLGTWVLYQSGPGPDGGHEIWEAPAQANVWTRFALDVVYSTDPNIGSVRVYADLNGDGDFADPSEESATIRTATLKTEIDGPNGSSDGYSPGDSLPSHLRAGIYHNPTIDCPAPSGCAVELDNVQVIGP